MMFSTSETNKRDCHPEAVADKRQKSSLWDSLKSKNLGTKKLHLEIEQF